jgi:MoaA/NifB/PqqE/SkfB family radical SAM enzyme
LKPENTDLNAVPRLVALETTSYCNATCSFCPNNALARGHRHMSQGLFEDLIEQCREFRLEAIEPFLQGEPMADPKIMDRLELIRSRLPSTKLRLYSNGYALSPKRIDELTGLGIDKLYISLNTLNPKKYQELMGLNLARTLENLSYLTDPVRRSRVANVITFRMTRTADTTVEEQRAFVAYCKEHRVRSFIVGLFNYKGDIWSDLPVPGYPCEHIDRLDVLSNGKVPLCCMDQDAEYSWGDLNETPLLDVYRGEIARRYREMHRTGRRQAIEPCGTCNLFWPSFEGTTLPRRTRFAVESGLYFLRHGPTGIKAPRRNHG